MILVHNFVAVNSNRNTKLTIALYLDLERKIYALYSFIESFLEVSPKIENCVYI